MKPTTQELAESRKQLAALPVETPLGRRQQTDSYTQLSYLSFQKRSLNHQRLAKLNTR